MSNLSLQHDKELFNHQKSYVAIPSEAILLAVSMYIQQAIQSSSSVIKILKNIVNII